MGTAVELPCHPNVHKTIAGSTSEYLLTFIFDLTILFLVKLEAGFHLSVNVVTRIVSPLGIIYGVVSNPCISIYIICGKYSVPLSFKPVVR